MLVSLFLSWLATLTQGKLGLGRHRLRKEARLLQALLSRREPIAQDLRRERNRLEKANAIAHIGVTH